MCIIGNLPLLSNAFVTTVNFLKKSTPYSGLIKNNQNMCEVAAGCHLKKKILSNIYVSVYQQLHKISDLCFSLSQHD